MAVHSPHDLLDHLRALTTGAEVDVDQSLPPDFVDANPPTSPQHHAEPPSTSQDLTQKLDRSLTLEPSASTFKRSRPTQTGKAREMPGLTRSTMTEQEQGSRWQVRGKALRRWRELHKGPKFIKLENRAVRYRLTDVEAYERRTS